MEKINDRKNVIWNIIGASANAFNSLLFSIAVTRINGADEAGVFIYSFATACLLYFIGNYCGRTFQVTDISKKNSDTDYIYNRAITCVVMMLIAIIFTFIKGYNFDKSFIFIILCGYKCVEAFSERLYAIVQKKGNLYKVGISMTLKAIISFISLLVVDLITKNLILASLSTVVINILFIFIYDIKNIKEVGIEKTRFSTKAFWRIIKIGFFTFVLTFLGTYLINAPRYAIDDLLENNLQTVFGIIIMPATLMGLLGQYIIQPSLTKISSSIEKQKYKELKSIIRKLVTIITILGLIVTIVAFLMEKPVLELIYGIELNEYFISMMIIIIGSILYSISTILSAILIAMRKTLSQAIIYLVTAIIATVMSYVLVNNIQIQGASITYFITMFIVAFAFMFYTILNMKKYKEKWKLNENINNNSNI